MIHYIVKSKNINIDINRDNLNQIKDIGNFYSGDRFYTLINEYIDSNLMRKSKVLGFIVKFLYKSGNYKHDSTISNGRSWGVIIFDIFCVLCLISFFSLIIAIIGTSIGAILKSIIDNGATDTIGDAIAGLFDFSKGGKASALLISAIITGIIGIFWLIMVTKIRNKNKLLTLQAYVEKKVNTVLKLRWLIKFKEQSFDKLIKNKKEVQYCLLDNFESQGPSTNRWLNIQLINLLSSIFDDFNLVFKFKELSENEYNELNQICINDFKKIELIKI